VEAHVVVLLRVKVLSHVHGPAAGVEYVEGSSRLEVSRSCQVLDMFLIDNIKKPENYFK